MKNKNGHESASERHKRQIAKGRTSGGYFQASRDHVRLGLLKKLEAFFLFDLVNRWQMVDEKSRDLVKMNKKSLIDDKGFFRCTVKYLTNPKYMTWTKDEQRRIIPILVSKGIITIKKKGIPGSRWLRINFRATRDKLDELEKANFPSQCQKPPTTR